MGLISLLYLKILNSCGLSVSKGAQTFEPGPGPKCILRVEHSKTERFEEVIPKPKDIHFVVPCFIHKNLQSWVLFLQLDTVHISVLVSFLFVFS